MSSDDKATTPTPEELAAMTPDELVRLGSSLDDVEIAYRQERWPVAGTRAEKRAERAVAGWFILSGLSSIAAAATFVFWPWQYDSAATADHGLYVFYTPVLGLTIGLAILGVGVGAIAYSKKFIPEEISVQQRHIGGSPEVDQKTTIAVLNDSLQSSGIMRRSLIKRSLGFGAGALGIMAVIPLGGLVKNPWAEGATSPLWTSGWTPTNNEKIYLRRDTGRHDDVALVRAEDLDAGAIETVFPFRESERGNTEALLTALRRSDNPVMLIRLRPDAATTVIKRSGQEDFNYGDYYAYSKICTHLGCPTSLYESQTNRILCPCHQSQFDLLNYAKPIFGPAARPLPQLPISVDADGYLVAKGDFIESIGPAFWERKS